MRFRLALVIAVALASPTLALVGVLSYRQTVHEDQDQQWVTHTHQVLEILSATRSDLLDAESNAHAFLLAGEEFYLQPFESSSARAESDLDTCRSLTIDNPRQQTLVAKAQPLMKARLAQLRNGVAIRQQHGAVAGASLDQSTVATQAVRELRTTLDEMESQDGRC